MRKIYVAILFSSLLLIVSCASLGGNSGVAVDAAEVEKSFEPKTSWAFVDSKLNRPTLNVFLANYDFNPKNRGDLFRPGLDRNPENIIVRFEVLNPENADPKDVFKPGVYNLEDDSSKQRFSLLNIIRIKNGSVETVKVKKYKEAKVNIESVTDEEVSGTFDIQFVAIGENNTDDENASAKGSFKAKFWKEN